MVLLRGVNRVMQCIAGLTAGLLVAGIGGCGSVISGAGAEAVQGDVLLVDAVGGSRYLLGVTNGSAVLADASGLAGAATASPQLKDTATGESYVLSVRRGALTMAPDGSSAGGLEKLQISDSATSKPYGLSVVRGALTLIAE